MYANNKIRSAESEKFKIILFVGIRVGILYDVHYAYYVLYYNVVCDNIQFNTSTSLNIFHKDRDNIHSRIYTQEKHVTVVTEKVHKSYGLLE